MFMTADATATATADEKKLSPEKADFLAFLKIAGKIGPLYPGLPAGCPDDCGRCEDWYRCPHYNS